MIKSVLLVLGSDGNLPLMSAQAVSSSWRRTLINMYSMPTGLSGTVIKGVWGTEITPGEWYLRCQRVNTL